MTSKDIVETVRLAYDVAWVRRSVDDLRGLFSKDYVFHARPEWPGAARYGPDEMTEFWADIDNTFGEFNLVAAAFEQIGDEHVLVTVEQSARMRASEARVGSTIYHLWRVPGGQLLETRAYGTREEALEAVALR